MSTLRRLAAEYGMEIEALTTALDLDLVDYDEDAEIEEKVENGYRVSLEVMKDWADIPVVVCRNIRLETQIASILVWAGLKPAGWEPVNPLEYNLRELMADYNLSWDAWGNIVSA